MRRRPAPIATATAIAVVVTTLLALLPPPSASAAGEPAPHYRFIVTGDGRSDRSPRPGDGDGINQTVLKELVREVLRVKPLFVLFTGDLVYGSTNESSFRSQLRSWIGIMKPVYDAGIHVYPVRGNHDIYSANAEQAWRETFSGPYALPQNGPEGEKDMTYAAVESNALILGLDEWGSHPRAVNLAWLRKALDDHPQPVVLIMGHYMAFRSGQHKDNLDNNRFLRDRFIDLLLESGARVYFAGHDHLYDHERIHFDPATAKARHEGHPPGEIHQLVVGTAGAPFYQGTDFDGDNGPWTIEHMKHIRNTWGYMLGEVNGLDVKLWFYGRTAPGVYAPMDSLRYRAGRGGAGGGTPGH